jgi:hypothetical protein
MWVLLLQVLQQVAVKTFSPTLGSLGVTLQDGKWAVCDRAQRQPQQWIG